MTNLSPIPPVGAATGAPRPPESIADLRRAAQAFEAILLRQMIGSMRSAQLTEGLFSDQSTAQFQDMADARIADDMSHTANLGIADMLTRQFAGHVAAQAGVAVPSASRP